MQAQLDVLHADGQTDRQVEDKGAILNDVFANSPNCTYSSRREKFT